MSLEVDKGDVDDCGGVERGNNNNGYFYFSTEHIDLSINK